MKRSRIITAGLVLAFTGGCKQRGTIDIGIAVPEECAAATHVAVYLIRGGVCGDCACGECLGGCSGDACTLGCGGGYCTIDELAAGITLTPERAGTYAVVYQLVAIDGTDAIEVALACADGIQLENDGTSSASVEATASCCPVAIDAGGVDAL